MRRLLSAAATALVLIALLSPASQGAQRQAQGRHAYRGKTSQNRRIQLTVSDKQITLIRFKVRMLCRDGSLLFGDASDFEPTPLSSTGRFSDLQRGHTDTVSWRGKVRGGSIKGTLRVKDRLSSGVRCDSGPVRFEAKRAGGRR